MSAPRSLQQLSDDIVVLASDIIGMSQPLKNRGSAEFMRATPQQRAPIVNALSLTETEVRDMIATDLGMGPNDPPAEHGKRVQIWDYDTKTATVEDLTKRRDLLRSHLRVLEYLRVH
jgi:hypothetical protein